MHEAARAMQVVERGEEGTGAAVRNKEPSGNRHNTGLRRAIPSQIRAATGQVLTEPFCQP